MLHSLFAISLRFVQVEFFKLRQDHLPHVGIVWIPAAKVLMILWRGTK
jgi:hypothetical protein